MRVIYLFFCILFFLSGTAQPAIKQYVQADAKAIASVNAADTDFTDLEIIGKAIGNKRVVMLGELYHGDGTTMEAKSRLVKYLHQKKGFSVLVFESDFYALNKGWDACLKNTISMDYLIHSSIYPIWTQCRQNKALFDYIKHMFSTLNPIYLSGIDNQQISAYSRTNLSKDIKQFLDTVNIPFVKTEVYPRYISLTDSIRGLRSKTDAAVWDTLVNYTSLVLHQVKSRYSSDNFYVMVLENLKAFAQQAKYTWAHPVDFIAEVAKYRDPKMADNLKWLTTVKYPDAKIIVWAHNLHVGKNPRISSAMGYQFTLDTALLNQTYVLGFTEYEGKGRFTTRPDAVAVSKLPPNSLEGWLKKRKQPYLFIDFSAFVAKHPENREIYYMHTSIDEKGKFYWHKVYDGIFFIEKMEPCENIGSLLLKGRLQF